MASPGVDDGPNKPANFADRVRLSPVGVVAGAMVVAAGVTAGTMQWFATKATQLAAQAHQREVDDLEERFASLRLAVGNEEDLLLNVTELQIANSEVPLLPERYTVIDYADADGRFYVSVPTRGDWRMRSMSEMDLARLTVPEAVEAGSIPGNFSLVVWRPETDYPYVSLRTRTAQQMRYSMAPLITVSKVSHERLQLAVGGLLEPFERLEELRESILTSLRGPASNPVIPGTQEVLDALAEAFRGDSAALFLNGILSSAYASLALIEGKFELVDIDKKGNVLYLRTLTTMNTVEEEGNSSQVYIDSETLYIGTGDHIILISASVPSRDLRSDAYSWVRAWLTGLRIPE